MANWSERVDDVPPDWVGERVARWLIICALTLLVFGAIAVGTYVLVDVGLELVS